MDAHLVSASDWPALAARMASRRDEIEDLLGLPRDYAESGAGAREAGEAVAWAIACARNF